ncbi:hypothetical protein [Tomitella cavernea]|uniref:Uncharacterized protein n=1 Tax=Tomitella cavernea TaxID=1387982 RepID=A0ABP9D7B2_9ACTN|nr:hypothetical protein [Tomitella cavernea]
MPGPARRTGGALNSVLDTIINVLTLPFRMLKQLFGAGGRRGGGTRR